MRNVNTSALSMSMPYAREQARDGGQRPDPVGGAHRDRPAVVSRGLDVDRQVLGPLYCSQQSLVKRPLVGAVGLVRGSQLFRRRGDVRGLCGVRHRMPPALPDSHPRAGTTSPSIP